MARVRDLKRISIAVHRDVKAKNWKNHNNENGVNRNVANMSFMERIALETQNQYQQRWIARENAINSNLNEMLNIMDNNEEKMDDNGVSWLDKTLFPNVVYSTKKKDKELIKSYSIRHLCNDIIKLLSFTNFQRNNKYLEYFSFKNTRYDNCGELSHYIKSLINLLTKQTKLASLNLCLHYIYDNDLSKLIQSIHNNNNNLIYSLENIEIYSQWCVNYSDTLNRLLNQKTYQKYVQSLQHNVNNNNGITALQRRNSQNSDGNNDNEDKNQGLLKKFSQLFDMPGGIFDIVNSLQSHHSAEMKKRVMKNHFGNESLISLMNLLFNDNCIINSLSVLCYLGCDPIKLGGFLNGLMYCKSVNSLSICTLLKNNDNLKAISKLFRIHSININNRRKTNKYHFINDCYVYFGGFLRNKVPKFKILSNLLDQENNNNINNNNENNNVAMVNNETLNKIIENRNENFQRFNQLNFENLKLFIDCVYDMNVIMESFEENILNIIINQSKILLNDSNSNSKVNNSNKRNSNKNSNSNSIRAIPDDVGWLIVEYCFDIHGILKIFLTGWNLYSEMQLLFKFIKYLNLKRQKQKEKEITSNHQSKKSKKSQNNVNNSTLTSTSTSTSSFSSLPLPNRVNRQIVWFDGNDWWNDIVEYCL